jgi:hypothetical protein
MIENRERRLRESYSRLETNLTLLGECWAVRFCSNHYFLCKIWGFHGGEEWRLLGCYALVRTDVLEELSASFIRVTRIGELGTTLAETNNPDEGGAKFIRNVGSYKSHTA